MTHFMVVFIPYINLLKLSWIIKCLWNMKALNILKSLFSRGDMLYLKHFVKVQIDR